ncbi:hypothetical protein E1265_28955 [Streptomyces sp. 8K308]|uniref:hypothetical protein n=1 Tax=Streptomyces sp. 8K308 TaxID=2530388 RepID=UPI00104F43E8|nr:hypothetical protein [Streptomyces sp. 8K308]TDC12904.1 hypothetical protein E1265_28955 [Streptomyces sp. 8K308]
MKRVMVGALLAGAVVLTGLSGTSSEPTAFQERVTPADDAQAYCGSNPSPPATCAPEEMTIVPGDAARQQ